MSISNDQACCDVWQALYRLDGIKDAEKGVYNPPHSSDDDPQDQQENHAYKEGFEARRKELGGRFKWA